MDLLLSFLSASVSAGILFLIFLAVRPLLEKRVTAGGIYGLLLAVALRLLIPFSPELAWGLSFDELPEAAPFHEIHQTYELPHTEDSSAAGEMQKTLPTVQAPASASPDNDVQSQSNKGNIPWAGIAVTVWLTGALVKFAANLWGYFAYRRRILGGAVYFAKGEAILEEIAQGRYAPKVLVSRAAGSPMVIGLFRPVIVLSRFRCTDDHLRNILRHQYCHYRRWNAYMRSEGYVYSGSPDRSSRNNLGKMHPDPVAYSELSEDDKGKDRRMGAK